MFRSIRASARHYRRPGRLRHDEPRRVARARRHAYGCRARAARTARMATPPARGQGKVRAGVAVIGAMAGRKWRGVHRRRGGLPAQSLAPRRGAGVPGSGRGVGTDRDHARAPGGLARDAAWRGARAGIGDGMSWPWRRRGANVAASTERAENDALRRLRRAHGDTEAIDRRAAELARELPAGELYM